MYYRPWPTPPHPSPLLVRVCPALTAITLFQPCVNQGHPTPMDGIQPAVKAALTKAYNKGSSSRVIRTADMVTLPGIKKVLKKRVAAILEPVEESLAEDNGDTLEESEKSDTEDLGTSRFL